MQVGRYHAIMRDVGGSAGAGRTPLRLLLVAALVAALTIVSGGPARAATLTISGTVTDSRDGSPMANVCITVGVPGQFCWTSTNSQGKYFIDLEAQGAGSGISWTIYFIRSGFVTNSQTVIVDGAETLDMVLSPTPGVTPPATVPPPGNSLFPPPAEPAPTTYTVYLPNVTRMLGGRFGWHTPFIVQNIGTASTSLDVKYYRFSDGSLVATRSATLLAGRSFVGSPNDEGDLPADTQFSVVVRSTGAPVVAVVNEHQGQGSTSEALSYSGFSSGATSVYLPLVSKMVGGWLTTMIMQNLGTSTTTVNATFTGLSGSGSATVQRTVQPGRSQFIDPRTESSLLDGVEYSVTLTSAQPIAVVANAHNDLPGTLMPMGDSYNGVASVTATTTYAPYVAKNTDGIGRSTRLVVQNTGTSAATPRLSFVSFAGGAATVVMGPSLAAGTSWSYTPTFGDGEYALTVTQGRFAVLGTTISPSTAMFYTGTSSPATKLFMPNVTRTLTGGPPDPGWTTPILIQSATATSATLSWYRFSDGSLVTTQTVSLTPGATRRVDPTAVSGLSDNSQYAVVLASSGTVSAIVTELNLSGGDNAMVYKAFTE